MNSETKLQRLQFILLLAFVVLVLTYWFGYRALAKRSAELDRPLATLRKQLAGSSAGVQQLDLAVMTNRLKELDATLAGFRHAGVTALARIEPNPEIAEKIKEPFQLFDFEKSRLALISETRALAVQHKVSVGPDVLSGYPDFVGEVANPSLLWAQMSLVHQVVASALVQAPRAVSGLKLLPARSHLAGRQMFLEEFPIRVEIFGSMDSIASFLQSLPFRAGELKENGQREIPAPKQAMFVDRMILKNSTNAPNEMHLDVVVTGFVRRS